MATRTRVIDLPLKIIHGESTLLIFRFFLSIVIYLVLATIAGVRGLGEDSISTARVYYGEERFRFIPMYDASSRITRRRIK